jgi:hypothetical protein
MAAVYRQNPLARHWKPYNKKSITSSTDIFRISIWNPVKMWFSQKWFSTSIMETQRTFPNGADLLKTDDQEKTPVVQSELTGKMTTWQTGLSLP